MNHDRLQTGFLSLIAAILSAQFGYGLLPPSHSDGVIALLHAFVGMAGIIAALPLFGTAFRFIFTSSRQ